MRNQWKRAALASGAALAAIYFSPQRVETQAVSCLVATANGYVQGADRGTSCAFLGVPYAAPPIGALRWRPSQPAAPWAPAWLNASVAPPSCPLINMSGQLAGSEDCLKMNIWTPDPAPGLPAPVLVWLHPGAFTAASANLPATNGQKMAEQTRAIVVAPNYRLGPLGFLRHEALTAEDPAYGSSGNYGLLDQRAALVWVRDNIAAFGGDPNRITIAGSSAGSLSAGFHLVSPGSAGLFEGAIMQSGVATSRWRDAPEADAQGRRFADALGCTDALVVLPCLRGKSQNQVLLALPTGMDQIAEGARVGWGPVVDGLEIPDQPRRLFEAGSFAHVPIVLGTNRDDGWPFVDRSFPAAVTVDQYEARLVTEFGADAPAVLAQYPPADFASTKDALARLTGDVEYVCEARRLARLVERTGTPTFLYSFEYEVDAVAPDRVIHGLETNLVFGNNFAAPSNYVLNEADLVLFRSMSGFWTRFAATGNPNHDVHSESSWPAFKHPTGQGRGADKYLVFDNPTDETKRPREASCDFWEPFFFRSVTGAVPASMP